MFDLNFLKINLSQTQLDLAHLNLMGSYYDLIDLCGVMINLFVLVKRMYLIALINFV